MQAALRQNLFGSYVNPLRDGSPPFCGLTSFKMCTIIGTKQCYCS